MEPMTALPDALPPVPEMERAWRDRDPSYDGIFFLAVRTTGVFCRPSCAARKPLAENVEYFGNAGAAQAAGYRPCKRCRPLATDGRPPRWVSALLDRLEEDPERRLRDADLEAAGIDPVRARRWFRAHYGMTFQGYQRARRLGTALGELREGAPLDDVVLGHGFESHSGFRDAFARLFGAPPGRARAADCVVVDWLPSPLGPLVVGATAEGVCLLEFGDRRTLGREVGELRRRFGVAAVPGRNDHLERLAEELERYFAGELREFSLPLRSPGTPFQQRVWDELRRIPYGETRSYEELARAIGAPGGQRAVGRANGSNRVAILIPCHRVVNKGGGLGGYGGGLWRKRILLALERGQRPLAAGGGRGVPGPAVH